MTAPAPLTPKEHQAWQLHRYGLSSYHIAHALGISRRTARDRIKRAQQKLEPPRGVSEK
jgi:DNA-binding CsgD family transcriptional regulator